MRLTHHFITGIFFLGMLMPPLGARSALANPAYMLMPPLGARAETAPGQIDLVASAREINKTMRAHHFDVRALDTPAYRDMESNIAQLATRATSQVEFIDGFNQLWTKGPFSHVRLALRKQSADKMAEFFDQMNVGGKGAILTWRGEVAVLTVNTMMGQDTIRQIDAAYQQIISRPAVALIIDLRNNEGGAFAVRPLVSHAIDKDIDAGAFLSQKWAIHTKGLPGHADILAMAPWQGWSIRRFWRDVQDNALTRIRFESSPAPYTGPLFVLTSSKTASAAELATDALLRAGRAVVIGERTAGKMLSQTLFDLDQGLQLSLPIADYVALHSGRIEGQGVTPSLLLPASAAMDKALELAGEAARR